MQPGHVLFPGFASQNGPRIPLPTKPISTFGYAWGRLRKVLKINPNLRLHDMRHNIVSDFAETNTPSAAVCEFIGWKNPAMRQRYEHLKDRLGNGSREALNNVIQIRKQRIKLAKTDPTVTEVIHVVLRQKMAS
jgi:hypothetical protein